MITLTKSEAVTVKLRLNPSKVVDGETVTLQLDSPSQSQLNFTSTLTEINEGFYSISLSISDTSNLVDNSYTYILLDEDENELKTGEVSFKLSEVELFDYTLDFTLA